MKNPLPKTRKQILAYDLVNNKQKGSGSSNFLTAHDKNNFVVTRASARTSGGTSLGTSLSTSLGTSLGTSAGTKVKKTPLLKDSYAILDLDHTLINTETTDKPDKVLEENCDFHFKLQGHHYYVFKRPGVDKFIDTLINNFKGIAVWTAAMATYAKQIIKGLFGIKKAPSLLLIWTRCQTQNNEDGLYKALTKLWNDPVYGNYMNPLNTVHIDNTESVMRYNSDQALLVPDFHYYTVQKNPYGLKTFNTTDNYLIFLDDLIKELVKTKQDTLKNFITKGNKLTKWYLKSHSL